MEGSKETELVMAVLLYAVRCLFDGDHAALRDMNFGPKEIEALRALKLADLSGVDALRAHCLDITLDRAVFWPMIEHLQAKRASEELQHTLMAADASLEMMQSLFGMGSREYTRVRRTLTLTPTVGRPPELDEAASAKLWLAWQPLAKDAAGQLSPAAYLTLHETTELPLRLIWNQVQRWVTYGPLGSQEAR